MTSRNGPYGDTPVLDRLLTKSITEIVPAGLHTYTFETGHWGRTSDTEVILPLRDANGLSLPAEVATRSEITINGADAEVARWTDINRFNTGVTGYTLRFTGVIAPEASGDLVLQLELPRFGGQSMVRHAEC